LKISEKKITRTDLEKRILERSLRDRYAKLEVWQASAIETTPKDSIKERQPQQ
jgi:penicillin-binding protein 2